MKCSIFKGFALLAIIVLLVFSSCSEKKPEHGFTVPKDHAVQALTIGWYVPVNVLKELVGPSFKPAVVKDEDNGTVMIYIVSGAKHQVDSLACDSIKAAYLLIPVVKPGNMKFAGASAISNTLVCPMNIVDQSAVLGNKFHNFGFSTYTGKINLDVTWSGEKYHVKASVETSNGTIEILCQFEEKPEKLSMTTAVFNPKADTYSYFTGEEKMQQIINGKGNLKTGGENLIKAMNVSGHPYYLKLDLDVSWEFDFEKE